MMGKNIRWGILGTGRMAGDFATGLQRVDDAELVAVGSRTHESAQTFATKFNIPNIHASYENLARDDKVDVIYIATPHNSHKDNTILCLENNKAVLCEKPFTINAKEAELVIGLARSKNLFLMEAMWTRYIPAIIKLRELLDQKVIGDVQIMLAGGAFIPEFDPEFYLFNHALGGGVLLDAGVYLVSMASMVIGLPVKVMAMGQLGNTGVDEHDAILLEHADGALANLYVSLRGKSSPDLTLIGDKGKIYAHAPIFCPDKLTISIDGNDEIIELPFEANGYQFEAMEVGRCLREGKLESAVMPLDETLQIMQTMDKIRAQIGLKYSTE
jgi:predicted dehydrogenase